MSPEEPTDLIIVGGGPTGLFAAYYAGFRGLRSRIIDSLPELGGQVAAMYPEKPIYDVAGFPKVTGRELVDRLVEQAGRYSPDVRLEEPVRLIRRDGDASFTLTSDRGEHRGRAVLVTAGIGMFQPKRLASFAAYEGKGLVYFVRSMEVYRGKRVLIVGGGDSAVDWTLNLAPIASEVTLIHRRDVFRAHEDSLRQLRASRAVVKTPYELGAVRGDGRVESAMIYHNTTRAQETLAVDAVVAAVGFVADIGPLSAWGLELDSHSIVVNSRMETSEAGIYAAGDIVSYPGKVRLIATDFGEAATAINNAAHFLNPASTVFPGYSTHKG
ncbi:MAG: NAD(P)/FAD-dependent oxidoreductase [Acidobacteria bacterium]|nr:NAD(P)/FAD-dependent oxidoreductase [Acidobacteriota bacterium]